MKQLSIKEIKQNLNFKTTSDKPNHTLTWFKSLIDDKLMDLNPSYQRGEVWSEEGMKALIISLISGIAIPPIILNERIDDDDNTYYDVMDGKQRLTTILRFIDNKYHIDLNGKKVYFKQVSNNIEDYSFDERQNKKFMDTEIQTVIYKNLEESQQRDIFERINYGTPLKYGERLKGSNGSGLPLIEKIINIYSSAFEEKLSIKNDRNSHYLKFAAIIALTQEEYSYASSGEPVLKYVKETLEYSESILNDTINKINNLLDLHDKIYDYHLSRTAKKFSKLWNWSDIMFMMYILSKKNFKDVVKFNKFLWHLKNNTNKINDWDCNELYEFQEEWKKIGRKNTNNEEIYTNRTALFDKIISWINKKIPSSLRDEIALKKFRDSEKKKCPVCNTHIIEKTNYQAGHIISRNNGGLIYFNNIIPICQTCNTSMGSKDLDIYCQEQGTNVNIL